MTDIALGQHFKVVIDGQTSLGVWSKCEGLSVEYEVYEYKEGGVNSHVHRLQGRGKFPNIKLSRHLTKETTAVASWLSKVKPGMKTTTMRVSVLDEGGTEIAAWSFAQVYPVRWTGPTLDIAQNNAATETLELAHGGFLGGAG